MIIAPGRPQGEVGQYLERPHHVPRHTLLVLADGACAFGVKSAITVRLQCGGVGVNSALQCDGVGVNSTVHHRIGPHVNRGTDGF